MARKPSRSSQPPAPGAAPLLGSGPIPDYRPGGSALAAVAPAVTKSSLMPAVTEAPFLGLASRQKIVGKRNARALRAWADRSAFVRAAINHRKAQVAQAQWDILAVDPTKPCDEDAKLAILTLLHNPNPARDSFRSFIERILEDELVLDAGVIEKEFNGKGLPIALYDMDAAEIRVVEDWDGSDQGAARYYWVQDSQVKAAYTNDELVYIVQNPATHRAVGLSPLEVLYEVIEQEMEAMRYNASQVRQTAPPGILNLGRNAGRSQVEQFKAYWEMEVAGRATTAITGGTEGVEFVSMGMNQKDMQFLEWVNYLCRKIAAVFMISPQDIGILFDINKSTSQTQQALSEDRGLRTLLTNNEEYINREVLADFRRVVAKRKYVNGLIDYRQFIAAELACSIPARSIWEVLQGGKRAASYADGQTMRFVAENDPLNLMFSFTELNQRDMAGIIEITSKQLVNKPTMAINEARREQGLDPVEGGDKILIDTPNGPVPLDMIEEMAKKAMTQADAAVDQTTASAEAARAGARRLEAPGVESGDAGGGKGSGSAAGKKQPVADETSSAGDEASESAAASSKGD